MKLGVEEESDLGGANVEHVVLVVLRAAQLSDNFSKHVILAGADRRNILRDKMVNGEDVRQLHVQGWLRPSIEVVVLINVELCFRITNINY